MAPDIPLTIDDFERLPARMVENRDLVDGRLVEVAGKTPLQNWLRDVLIEVLLPIIRELRLGLVVAGQDYDFLGNAHGPDVSFFGAAKVPLLDRDRRVQRFVPDLAIEIASDTDTFSSLMQKMERYLEAGVVEVWLISAETRDILTFTRDGVGRVTKSGILATNTLPGIAIDVEELFRI